jgi:hypothetical protein
MENNINKTTVAQSLFRMSAVDVMHSQPVADPSIHKRVRCEYDLVYQEEMALRKQNILNELKILMLTGKSVIFENQELIAYEVVAAFKNRKIINVMVVSKTQSGKTGSMCATIKQYLEDTGTQIPIKNIYIITGLSSCEWKEQTKERMPESIQARVFHRCELPTTFVDEIKDKQNILIIMDEIQVAAQKGQTIYKAFDKAGLLNKTKLYEHDVKILEYTATPDGTIYDLMKWKDASAKILAEVGDGYVSSYDLLMQNRVRQYKELCGYDRETGTTDDTVFDNIREVKTDIDAYDVPLYHIIRTRNGIEQDITIQNFKRIFDEEDAYVFINYDRESEIEDINKTLAIKPTKHTFIFIKEMLRCAKTLKKTYIGILYDRYSSVPDDTTIIQGLIGRDTGYDNNGRSICYTNVESIVKYEQLWNSRFEDTTVKWNSKTTKYKNGVLSGKNTFNDPTSYDGFTVETSDGEELKETVIRKFKTQEEAKEYYNKELKIKLGGNGPKKRKPNENGFYLSTIGKGNDRTRVRSFEEIQKVRKWALNETHHYTFHPCYRDVTDQSTLEWWLIYYE